jgi:hypothetical protein
MSGNQGWIGCDLDGTLAHYDGWVSPTHIGTPIAAMVERVKAFLAAGGEVRIFTARCYPFALVRHRGDAGDLVSSSTRERLIEAEAAIDAVQDWCERHIGRVLPVTCVKDYAMAVLYDDRAHAVEANTGRMLAFIDGQAVLQETRDLQVVVQ